MENKNTDIYEKVRNIRNQRDRFSKYCGIISTEIKEGYGNVEAQVRPEYVNTSGSIHGGLLFSLADSACANAAFSDGFLKTTLNCSFDFLRAPKNPVKLIGEAFEVKKGRTICVYDAVVKDETGAELARGSFTYFNLGKEISFDE